MRRPYQRTLLTRWQLVFGIEFTKQEDGGRTMQGIWVTARQLLQEAAHLGLR